MGKVGNKNFAGVHDFLEVYCRAGVFEDSSDSGALDELADFVEDGGNGFGAEFGRHFLELVDPEIFENFFLDAIHDFGSKALVSEDFGDVCQGAIWASGDGKKGVAENIFESGTPGVAVELLEDRHDA